MPQVIKFQSVEDYFAWLQASGSYVNILKVIAFQMWIVVTYKIASTVGVDVAQGVWPNLQANPPNGALIYTVPVDSAGIYQFFGSVTVLQKATTSGTTPSCGVTYSVNADGIANVAAVLFGARTNDATTVAASSTQAVFLAQGATITLNSTGYASSGAVPLIYTMRISIFYIGPYQ
jgi:hypothetical protein